jgi:hypothetical protein
VVPGEQPYEQLGGSTGAVIDLAMPRSTDAVRWLRRTAAPNASPLASEREPIKCVVTQSVLGPHGIGNRWLSAGTSGHGRRVRIAAERLSTATTSGGEAAWPGVRIPSTTAAPPLAACPRGRWSPRTALTFVLSWGAVSARCEHRCSPRPCHSRAISSGHQRYPTDSHGHS